MNHTTIRKFLRIFLAFLVSTLFAVVVLRYLLGVYDYEQSQHDKYVRVLISESGAQAVSAEKGE